MSKDPKELLDEFHYHEALDRTHMVCSIIDDHLIQHPVCKVDKKISRKIEHALEILSDVYQDIGHTIVEKFDSE